MNGNVEDNEKVFQIIEDNNKKFNIISMEFEMRLMKIS